MASKDRTSILPEGASIRLTMDGAEVTIPLVTREFSTGSLGYHAQDKVTGKDGRRYQLNFTGTLIHSNPDKDKFDPLYA